MRKRILRESIGAIADDPKIIRLATITTFVHSLLFILYSLYVAFSLTAETRDPDGLMSLLSSYLDILAPSSEAIVVYVLIAIVLLICYALLPPIWDAAMIDYIDTSQKSTTLSFGKWFTKFVPMFEYNGTIAFMNLITPTFALSRMIVYDSLNILTGTLLVMRYICALLAMFLLPYTKYFITLHDMSYFEAMRQSMKLAAMHFGTTMKFVTINILLYIRFAINIVIVIGIPLWLIYLASRLDFAGTRRFNIFVVSVFLILLSFTAYINGIIEAFFTTYRWKVYKEITAE